MDKDTYRLCETVFDVTGVMLSLGFYSGDSRRDAQLAVEWSEEFETKNKDREWDGEYLEEIEEFTKQKIHEFRS